MTITYENIVSHLLERVPEFRPAYEKHIAYYDEIITYVLFGELIRFMRDVYRASTPHKETGRREIYRTSMTHAQDIYSRLLTFIEDCANAEDEDVVTLIQTGFMESLHLTNEYYHPIVASLHPTSKKLFDDMEAGWREFRKQRLIEVLRRYKPLGVLIGTKNPELLLPPNEALHFADDLETLNVAIMGLDGWYYVRPDDKTAIGQDLSIDFYVGDAVLHGENRVHDSVAAVKDFITNRVSESTPFVSFTLNVPTDWDLFPDTEE